MALDTGSRKVYRHHPLANIVISNGITLAHYGLGAGGIVMEYARWPWASVDATGAGAQPRTLQARFVWASGASDILEL